MGWSARCAGGKGVTGVDGIPKKVVVGVWQGLCAEGDLAANLARTEQVIDQAAAAGCDFVCLPEVFLPGGNIDDQRRLAMPLDDPRLLTLAQRAGGRDVVTLVGLAEQRGDRVANTQVILADGKVLGHYTKTMLTGGDQKVMGFFDDELPIFEAKGVPFGVVICHDTSFPEVAATLAWKGARIIFAPHYNSIARGRMDDHRILVRNNNVGIAAHYNVVVARSNVIGQSADNERLGYGDAAIFGPNGAPLVEAGLFTEKLIAADVGPYLHGTRAWRDRRDLRPAIIKQLAQAALGALEK